MNTYTVSQDQQSGLWYCHIKGYPYVPYEGSFSEKKSEAIEYAKMCNGLPNNVKEIEKHRKEKFKHDLY